MEKPFEDLLSMLGAGQRVQLETGSQIFKGPYESHILTANEEGIRVAVPMENGKLVLVPVGTSVVVRADTPVGPVTFDSEVADRTGGKNRSLLLALPPIDSTEDSREESSIPVMAVSSGKGGVGKTTVVVNLAIALARLGKRVCVIDGDLGTANVDVLLNLSTPYNLAHVIHGERHMLEVVTEGPGGIIVLPGGSGFQDLTVLSDEQFRELIGQFQELEAYVDLMLIDTGSGLSPSVTKFIAAASEALLLTTPEPHAVTDCYALIKVLTSIGVQDELRLVVNRVESDDEAADIIRKMVFASRRFLQTELKPLGHLSDDSAVARSVRRQRPFVIDQPRSKPSLQIAAIAEKIAGVEPQPAARGTRSFLERMRRLVPQRGA